MMYLRRQLLSKPIMGLLRNVLPTIGETERIALEAGTVGWDGELFSGKPDWNKLLNFKPQPLSKEEQAFMDGPVQNLCKMLNDWEVCQARDLSPKVWTFLRKQKFFGIVIPKEYGGLGFSAAAHAAVVTAIATRSVTAAVTVMVPNSLGPGELLHRYGTKKQKDYFLPRLADGRELPCFALTEPHAGSDAASGQSRGVVVKENGKLGIRLTFNKRYITLAPIATVVGLAFRLYDPDHLLGDVEDIGITCALLPRETKGLNIGNRHDPLDIPFHNGPLSGTDVLVPLDVIIGGEKYAGQGWRMLMEALAAGRGISLPSLSVGASQFSSLALHHYTQLREQFGLPIGKFEGIGEQLGPLYALTYAGTATRDLTAGAIDAGEHPAVLSAISKAYLTQMMREAVTTGMDVQGGAAICRGPKNIFSRPYFSIPIGITVEGANILTRSLIIFGQGAMRCHPYVQKEADSLAAGDLRTFDTAFWKHAWHTTGLLGRTMLHRILGTLFTRAPHKALKDFTRLSTQFALLTDLALLILGGTLKRKESLSGRFADSLAWQYIASATLHRYISKGEPEAEKAIVDWVVTHAKQQISTAHTEILRNLKSPLITAIRGLFPRPSAAPTDKQTFAVVKTVQNSPEVLENLTGSVFKPDASEDGLGELIAANKVWQETVPLRKRLKQGETLTAKEQKLVDKAKVLQDKVIQVADFAPADFVNIK